MASEAARIKCELLSNGISVDENVLHNYGYPFIEKRRAYGIQDPEKYLSVIIPQELYILPERIVCSVNINERSGWKLKFEDDKYYIENGTIKQEVTFPYRPLFYDMKTESGRGVQQVITLYGGKSLGVFINRNCSIIGHGACHFCSLCNNSVNDFVNEVNEQDFAQSLEIALSENYGFSQVMLNGGNYDDLDDNFNRYCSMSYITREIIDKMNKPVELHLIVTPPKTISLLDRLKGLDIKVSMNMETYDDMLFKEFCPGKSKLVGHQHILNSLEYLSGILGRGNVFSIFVGGLEPIDTLEKGLRELGDRGIVPVINILHTDPKTPLENYCRPNPGFIMDAGMILQEIYEKYRYKPFYENCGRNSIDTEAYLKLFGGI